MPLHKLPELVHSTCGRDGAFWVWTLVSMHGVWVVAGHNPTRRDRAPPWAHPPAASAAAAPPAPPAAASPPPPPSTARAQMVDGLQEITRMSVFIAFWLSRACPPLHLVAADFGSATVPHHMHKWYAGEWGRTCRSCEGMVKLSPEAVASACMAVPWPGAAVPSPPSVPTSPAVRPSVSPALPCIGRGRGGQ